MATFLEEFKDGLVDAESIHDRIDEWHESTSTQEVPLPEYLGMTEQQYSDWLRDPATLESWSRGGKSPPEKST
jgi:hypothetical protein